MNITKKEVVTKLGGTFVCAIITENNEQREVLLTPQEYAALTNKANSNEGEQDTKGDKRVSRKRDVQPKKPVGNKATLRTSVHEHKSDEGDTGSTKGKSGSTGDKKRTSNRSGSKSTKGKAAGGSKKDAKAIQKD